MNEYKLYSDHGVIRQSDDAFIPLAEDNPDYQAYLVWVQEGNTADPYNAAPELEAIRIREIKEEASARIIAILPEVQQRNLLARMVELQDQETLTAEEQAEKDAAKAIWASIKAIRATSNTAETDGTAVADIIW